MRDTGSGHFSSLPLFHRGGNFCRRPRSPGIGTKSAATAFLLLLLLAAPAAAQSDAPVNQTAVIAFDDATKLLNHTWSDGDVTLTFQSDYPRTATITDVGSIPDTGAGNVNYKQVRLSAGRTQVVMDATLDRGSATVTINVGETLAAVSNPTQPLFENVVRTDLYILAIVTAGSTAFQVLGRRWWTRLRLKRGLIKVE